MVKEGTPGKYQLRAVEPGSRRPLIETYATREAVDARRLPLSGLGTTSSLRLQIYLPMASSCGVRAAGAFEAPSAFATTLRQTSRPMRQGCPPAGPPTGPPALGNA